ncbi:MAG: cytochrome c [Burkholderiales bacterium]|nr:cytochrome c [Burkholderiales bacterium]
MFTHKVARIASAFFLTLCVSQVLAAGPAKTPRLGKPISAEQAAKWNLNVFPDGTGLPAGSGSAVEGRVVYDQQCASCHGEGGRGGAAEELAGGSHALTGETPDKSIGIYWPYATTIFDFTRRAMPMDAPGSLSADQVYAVTAYLLFANEIIGEKDEMNAQTLPRVKMSNRDGFVWIDAKPASGK